jgi:hypothetical protein
MRESWGKLNLPGLDSLQKIFRRGHDLRLRLPWHPLLQIVFAGEAIGQKKIGLHFLGLFDPSASDVS